jgi:EmrB/QacA subfamily drug resistance transporter
MTVRESAVQFHTAGIVRLTRPQLVATLAGLMLAMLLAALDQTIVGTAEPRIIAQLSGFDRYPWVATAYLLTSTLAVPIFAKLSDLYGRKPLFLIAAMLFVAASALCGAAGALRLPLDGMNQLIIFRGLQGIGAGGVMGLIFTIVGDIFSPKERGRYQGFFSAVWGISSVFGPTLGGWLTDHVSWRACFYVNLPVGIIAISAIYFEFPHMHPRSVTRRLDWAGIATLIGSIVPLLLALTWATELGWGAARVDSLLVMSVLMLVVFLFAESRAIEPLIPLNLFRNPVISICSICVFVLGMGMFGVIIYLPLFMQGVLQVSATQSGNLMMPLMMGVVTGTFVSGRTMSRLGTYKAMAVVGSVLVAAGTILFARMTATTPRLEVVAGMIISGFGMGLLMPVYTVAEQNVAPRHQMGAATASTIFFRSIGSTVGVAIFGSVMLMHYHADFARVVPAGAPSNTIALFSNPLMLKQMQPQLEAAFSQTSGGLALMQRLLGNVPIALAGGLHLVFVLSAILMTAAILLHGGLKNLHLRHHAPEPEIPLG